MSTSTNPPSNPKSVSGSAFSNIAPPSTPLVCPGQTSSGGLNAFVKTNGSSFLYHGNPINLNGYTFYPSAIGGASAWHQPTFTHYIDNIMNMGAQLGQNLIRPTDFWDVHDKQPEKSSVTVWRNVDYLVCAAQRHAIFVEMDVSAFEKVLISKNLDAFDPNHWKTFLTAVGNHYKNQSAVAFYGIVGEPKVPKNSDEMNKLVNFYRVTTDTLRAADPNHLITAGGFNHMEEETPSLPWWQKIYALPNNDIVAFKTYSLDDIHLIHRIAAFAKSIHKPASDEEFGMPQSNGDATFVGSQGFLGIQMSRAQFYQAVYSTGEQGGVSSFIFWNLGCELRSNSFEINPKTPAVWLVVRQHGPDKPASPVANQPLCP